MSSECNQDYMPSGSDQQDLSDYRVSQLLVAVALAATALYFIFDEPIIFLGFGIAGFVIAAWASAGRPLTGSRTARTDRL